MKKLSVILLSSLMAGVALNTLVPNIVLGADYVEQIQGENQVVKLQEGKNECYVNQNLEVNLEENPSSGYEWEIKFPEGIKVIENIFIAPNTQIIGQPGIHKWVIKAEKTGNYRLNFSKKRSFEKEAIETKNFIIQAIEYTQGHQDSLMLNGVPQDIPGGSLEIEGQVLLPLRWIAMEMGAKNVTWDQKSKTVTIEAPLYNEEHLYLSYLNGITNSKEDTEYQLPKRVKNLQLPPYPLKNGNWNMFHKEPITITISDEGFSMSFAVYDYEFKNDRLYVTNDWLNTIFLADVTNDTKGINILYPTQTEIEQSLKMIQDVIAPVTPEETLALWIRGQQVRSGALQYSALSPELKKSVLAEKRGWVTGGSSPSAGKANIIKKEKIDEDTWAYEIQIDEMLQGKVSGKDTQNLVIKKYSLGDREYWLIDKVTGDLGLFSILEDVK